MKNTIKNISKMVLGLGLVAAGIQAVAGAPAPASPVPFYTPISISGSVTTGIQTSTNGTNYVFSNKTGTLNNAFILSEFYASDDAAGLRTYPAISKANGDYLAIVFRPFFTNYTPAVWATLPSGARIVVTNEQYYYQIDPWTGSYLSEGDIVILDAKGKLKANLTYAGLAENWYNEDYKVWYYTSYGKFSYSPETWNFFDHSALNFYFYFGKDNDYIRLQTWGGGSVTSTKGVDNVGGMSFTGTVEAYIANPANRIATPSGVYCDQYWIGPASYSTSSWIKWWRW